MKSRCAEYCPVYGQALKAKYLAGVCFVYVPLVDNVYQPGANQSADDGANSGVIDNVGGKLRFAGRSSRPSHHDQDCGNGHYTVPSDRQSAYGKSDWIDADIDHVVPSDP